MIPETKQTAVARALRDAFGVNACEDIRPLSGGMSTALVYRIVVRGQPYLLRLIMRDDALHDPTRQFACMRAGAGAGIAPRIWYASIKDRMLITDFVNARPFPSDPSSLIARTLRTLHALPLFPAGMNFFDIVDMFIRRFRAANIPPASATDELFGHYADVARVYPRTADLVASHNDLKPQNILFDGDRMWLLDWEAAWLNDRYADLAVVANFFVNDDAHEAAYLETYFGEPAGEYRQARYFLMRQAAHVCYTTCFMSIAAAGGARIDPDLDAPDFGTFHQRLVSGELSLEGAEVKLQYAKVHLNRALQNMRTQRFNDAVALVGSCHVSD